MQATLQAIENYYARCMNMQLGISIIWSVGANTKSWRFQWHNTSYMFHSASLTVRNKPSFLVYCGTTTLTRIPLLESSIINIRSQSLLCLCENKRNFFKKYRSDSLKELFAALYCLSMSSGCPTSQQAITFVSMIDLARASIKV